MTTPAPIKGGHSPWGAIQTVREYAPGIFVVSTSGHGGVWVAPELRPKIPPAHRQTPYSSGGWFEEDCDWCIPLAYVLGEPRARQELEDCIARGYLPQP